MLSQFPIAKAFLLCFFVTYRKHVKWLYYRGELEKLSV